jgi:hypothetical protein
VRVVGREVFIGPLPSNAVAIHVTVLIHFACLAMSSHVVFLFVGYFIMLTVEALLHNIRPAYHHILLCVSSGCTFFAAPSHIQFRGVRKFGVAVWCVPRWKCTE